MDTRIMMMMMLMLFWQKKSALGIYNTAWQNLQFLSWNSRSAEL